MVHHILPPQSTDLERAVDQTMPAWGRMADAIEPASIRADPQFQPWLAVQWQVAQFAPYFPTMEALLAEALPWLMERGNAASLRRALGWLGFHSVVIDEDGAWLHIDVGQPLQADQLAAVAHLVRASLPAHVHFYRVFHGYDVRPIVLDRGPALDAGMLDGYSGVPGGSDLVVSFGDRTGGTLPSAQTQGGTGAQTQVRVSTSRYDDMPVLDAWRLDSHVLAGLSGGVMELFSGTCNAPQPGGGQLLQRRDASSAVPWIAPAPVGAGTDAQAHALPVPIHPAPHWGGPWGQAHGGPWEPVFWLISSEET